MAFEERVQILSEAEQDELYGPPAFTSADQRFFFSLNDKELAIAKSLRHRGQRYMLVVLLGYFKAKPVVLNPGFHQIKQDLKYVYQTVLPGPGCRPFNLTPKENERIYQRVFQLCNYQRWNVKDHGAALRDYWHCCKVSDEAAFCLIQRPYISKTLLTRRISPRG
ncbi:MULTISPECIES: DUF4158 domain-containing protein, partial [unclassified Enterobacter cloacae complex]|uniref:DUF4158 domain-containing protein n=1 Tax=unclassified Enterobacter cloacae complex TaxID=2757714 RepID=UPI003AAC493C